jgi:hypothetical protein
MDTIWTSEIIGLWIMEKFITNLKKIYEMEDVSGKLTEKCINSLKIYGRVEINSEEYKRDRKLLFLLEHHVLRLTDLNGFIFLNPLNDQKIGNFCFAQEFEH